MYKAIKDDDFDVLCFASADGGFVPALVKAKGKGKLVIVAHTASVSNRLRACCDKIV